MARGVGGRTGDASRPARVRARPWWRLVSGWATAVAVLLSSALAVTVPATAASPPASRALLALGARGTAVLDLQRRLASLGYWLGRPDGVFGDATEQAVVALQKTAGIARDGIVGPVTRAALARGVAPRPRPVAGRVIEIDLERQLLLIVDGRHLDAVLNTSTGGGYWYRSGGVTAWAVTPKGHFRIYRQVDGLDVSPLGELWRPKYFVGGIALHGYGWVPPVAVSHGCVRVSFAAMNWIWKANVAPIGTAVYVY